MHTERMRAFPVVYVHDVRRSVAFYESLGFEKQSQHPPDGEPGYVSMRRGDSTLAVVTYRSPMDLIGAELGHGPRFEMFVYVDDVDETVERLRAGQVAVLRKPEDMPWGERIAYVADPDGNPVVLAAPTAQRG